MNINFYVNYLRVYNKDAEFRIMNRIFSVDYDTIIYSSLNPEEIKVTNDVLIIGNTLKFPNSDIIEILPLKELEPITVYPNVNVNSIVRSRSDFAKKLQLMNPDITIMYAEETEVIYHIGPVILPPAFRIICDGVVGDGKDTYLVEEYKKENDLKYLPIDYDKMQAFIISYNTDTRRFKKKENEKQIKKVAFSSEKSKMNKYDYSENLYMKPILRLLDLSDREIDMLDRKLVDEYKETLENLEIIIENTKQERVQNILGIATNIIIALITFIPEGNELKTNIENSLKNTNITIEELFFIIRLISGLSTIGFCFTTSIISKKIKYFTIALTNIVSSIEFDMQINEPIKKLRRK